MNTKKTKIVCTIGPSSWSPKVLKNMYLKGMNVARVNGAFADNAELKRVGELIRSISPDIALMLDIKGHEVRLNKFQEVINVKKGDEVVIGSSSKDLIFPATYPNLYRELKSGQTIMVDKGETILEVTKITSGKIYTKVISGNVIKGGKGMNFPGAHLSNPSITPKDIEQIDFVVSDNWDFVAASFIRNAKDAKTVLKQLKNSNTKLIAKIEDQQGVDNIDEILEVVDGIMVARGDLGAEIPLERLPIIQKEIIFKCNRAAKPVITATNMLESMTEKPLPTRAEVTDVANAVLDGSDALMTSGETSAGNYPVQTVEMMARIAQENEKFVIPDILEPFQLEEHQIAVAMSNAAYEVVMGLEIDKVVVVSSSGSGARLLSRLNLPVPILAFVSESMFQRQLQLTKGVEAFVFPKKYTDKDNAIHGLVDYMLENKMVDKTDRILLVGKDKAAVAKESFFPNIFEYLDLKNYK